MAVFIVSTPRLENDPALKARINEDFPDENYEVGRGHWLVAFKGTARQLYDKLFPNDEVKSVTVFRVSTYWGTAPEDMWEWIAAAVAKKEEASS